MATVALAGLVALAAAAVLVPRFIGAVPLTVLSGSMEPALSAGDLVVVREVEDPATIAVGDVITFQPDADSERLVTHRVVGLVFGTEGTTGFVTQGDANNVTDDPIVLDQVMGRVLYSLPLVGYLSGLPWGTVLVTAAAIGLVAYGIVLILAPTRRQADITLMRHKTALEAVASGAMAFSISQDTVPDREEATHA